MSNPRIKMKGLIPEKGDGAYEECRQAEIQTSIQGTLVKMFPLGNVAVSSKISATSVLFLVRILPELISRGDADDATSKWSDQKSMLDKPVNAGLVRVVSSALFILLVPVPTRRVWNQTSKNVACHCTTLKRRKLKKWAQHYPSIYRPRTPQKSSELLLDARAPQIKAARVKNDSREGPGHRKDRSVVRPLAVKGDQIGV